MKPRVLVLSEYYLPAYRAGGTVRSVSNLVTQLADEFQWFVVTRDRDLGSREPFPGVEVGAWTRVGSAAVLYASPDMLRSGRMLGLIRETPHDILYLNSFFSPHFSVLPQWSRRLGLAPKKPLLLAPRGELSAGALALKSRKKRLYLTLAWLAGAYRDTVWHASAQLEADQIVDALGVAPDSVRVARNLGLHAPVQPHPTSPDQAPPCRRTLRVCYLARLTRNKNLRYALEAVLQVGCELEFTVYGPREDPSYWAECEELIGRLPHHVRVKFEGPIPHEHVIERLSGHDLFFLPSAGENFGHVLVEAWLSGLPVLISDRTPWRELASKGIGWDLSLDDPARFARVIEDVARWPAERIAEVRRRCVAHGMSVARDDDAITANRQLLWSMVGSGWRDNDGEVNGSLPKDPIP